MKLQHVDITGFRSIDDASMEDCGGFNVLIGKNNAGKSSLLSAIALFFVGIEDGRIVFESSEIGRDIDFFDRNVDSPINIRLVFALTLAERDQLLHEIVNESPQLRNVIDGISPSLSLAVTWTIVSSPSRFGYVSVISISPDPSDNKSGNASRELLQVSTDVAVELFERTTRTSQITSDLSLLDRSMRELPDLWKKYARDSESRRVPLRFHLDVRTSRTQRSSSRESAVFTDLEQIFEEASSLDEVTTAVDAYRQRLADEIESLSNERIDHPIGTFSGEETVVPQYIRSLLKRTAEVGILHLEERRSDIGIQEARKLLDLKVRRGGEERLNSIRETVSTLLGVKIDAYAGPSDFDGPHNAAELDVDDFLVQANGAGIREALRIVLDYEFQRPQILLVEEPEIHLHPALEIAMMRYLKAISDECQVFITTHSTNFLDTAEMKNVYLVSRDGSTKVQLVGLAFAETAIPRELGMRLSSFFMYDRLLFVEGPTDEAVLREFASLLQTNLGQANVGFVPMGGARKFAYFATEASLSFLAKRQVKTWFLLDRDEGNDEQLSAFFKRVGSSATIKVLKKRELENYLLHPRAIARFITLKRHLSGASQNDEQPSIAEVEASLHSHADAFRELTIGKRVAKAVCVPVYPAVRGVLEADRGSTTLEQLANELRDMRDQIDERLDKIDEVYEQEVESVSAKWEAGKLDMVQGDVLLDAVCQDFGVRFKKEVDGPRIASLMVPEEIPPEIAGFLGEVVR